MVNKNIIPEGTRDLILDECVRKKELELEIENILNKWGYKEVITPTIEYYQTFNGGFQNLKEEDMYKFFDDKGRILVLRPDMTIPIARVVATKFKEINPPIRLRYTSNVFRVHESLGGKKNEYTDCGVELIGLNGIDSDVEILITALESLKILKETGYKIEVGNINFFNSAVEWLKLDLEQRSFLAKLIDEKSMKELEEYLDMLNVGDDYKNFFMKLPWLFGGVEILDIGEKYAINNEILNEIKYLRNIYEILDSLGYGDKLTFDLGIVPRLNYYTGIIFKGYVEGIGDTVLRGGRYDELISTFGRDLPAVGFSINLDPLVQLEDEKSNREAEKYRIIYNPKDIVVAIKQGQVLRNLDYVAELVPSKDIEGIKVVKEGGQQ